MRHSLRSIFVSVLIFNFIFAAQAAGAEGETAVQNIPTPIEGGMQGKISLDLRNIDVIDALKFLALKTGLNVVTTKAVTGRVTLLVQDAVAKDVFDIMLRSNNLAYDKQGEIYNVMTQEEYKALYGRNFSDTRKVEVFHLKYAIPEHIFNLVDTLKSEIGRVLVDTESGNVMVMDSPERIEMIGRALEGFEGQNEVKVFKLNYARAKEVEEVLKTQLDLKKVGLIKSDERNNQVVVQTLPERMTQIEKIIGDLDQKTKEVIIEAYIVQVKLSDELNTGFQWEG
ncbi:MAG: secretin N-terminal domain-containing protein, partial [Deltaproteobacteria bacterium]